MQIAEKLAYLLKVLSASLLERYWLQVTCCLRDPSYTLRKVSVLHNLIWLNCPSGGIMKFYVSTWTTLHLVEAESAKAACFSVLGQTVMKVDKLPAECFTCPVDSLPLCINNEVLFSFLITSENTTYWIVET